MGLVHHQAGPRDGAQDGLIDGDQLVGRQQHVEFDGSVFLQRGKRCMITADRFNDGMEPWWHK